MFLQQTFASVGKVLPAVIAPLVLVELNADPAWVGVYYGIAAAASLLVQMGCGSFIVRYGAMRMSQVALALIGGGIAVAATGSLPGFAASAIIAGGGGAVSTPKGVRRGTGMCECSGAHIDSKPRSSSARARCTAGIE